MRIDRFILGRAGVWQWLSSNFNQSFILREAVVALGWCLLDRHQSLAGASD
jgi:hypothetical protein